MISNAIMKTGLIPQTSPQNGLGEPQGSHFENQPTQGKFILTKHIFRDMNFSVDATGNSVVFQPHQANWYFPNTGLL